MNLQQQFIEATRREFLTTTASGLGGLALGSMLSDDGLLTPAKAADSELRDSTNPLAARKTHFPAKAKSCVFFFMAGAPSHLDLFNSKPKLRELDGKALPKSLLENVRFAFIQKDTATLRGLSSPVHPTWGMRDGVFRLPAPPRHLCG